MGQAGSCALTDDAAVIDIPAGYELVVTSDTLNAGTHFFVNSPPEMVAHKALRTNLSDLASMGATPLSYQLNLAFPDKPSDAWLAAFTKALLKDQERYNIYCSGGDTTAIKGALSISITALGLVKKGQSWRRANAQDGDRIILTDYVGDAWIGLQILLEQLNTEDNDYFINRYYMPPIKFINNNNSINAGVDISDGLFADIRHMCTASNLGAHIALESIPFSPQAQKLLRQNLVSPEQLAAGGDDYALALAFSGTRHDFYEIGYFSKDIKDLAITKNGQKTDITQKSGWTHF